MCDHMAHNLLIILIGGEINFDYQTSSENRRYGGNIKSCSHGELITVP
jgi:hypothetical protein